MSSKELSDEFEEDGIDDEEDIEEEEEDEEKHRLKKKRKKSKRLDTKEKKRGAAAYFIDYEASENDDDDESYDENEGSLYDKSEELMRYQKYDKEVSRDDRGMLPVRGSSHFASTVKILEQRFEGEADERDDGLLGQPDDEEEDEEDPELANVLPSMTDPKLWMVKLFKAGKEREAVIQIQNKYFKWQQEGRDLGISSCFAAQTLQGYIYVEAATEFKVKEALRGLRNINTSNDIKMVPVKEMPSVFSMGERNRYIPRPMDYVRVKSGLYAGDLGRIVSVEEQGEAVNIKLIPRVDLELLVEMDQNGRRNVYDREIMRKGRERPMKKFLDRDEVDAKGYRVEQGQPQRTVRIGGSTFDESGYIYKRFSLNRLTTGGMVAPQLSELKEFESSKTKLDEELASHARILRPTKQQLQLYRNGERVKIISGDLMNIECTITHLDEDGLDVQPDNKSLQPFKIPHSQVCKVFTTGNCVRAIAGVNAGDSGMIAHIDNEKRVATVFSFASRQQFESNLDYLTISSVEGFGRDGLQQIGGFSVGDLVTLTSCVGVLCVINKKGIVGVLTEDNELVNTNAAEIGAKLSSYDQLAVDSNRESFRIRARVQIINGSHKGLSGVVQHIRKNTVFVKISNRLENGGYVAVPASWTIASLGRDEQGGIGRMRGGGRRGGFRTRGRRTDALIGKQVKIVNDKKYKGRIATVRSIDGDIVNVLIQSTTLELRLRKDNIIIEDNVLTSSGGLGMIGGTFLNKPLAASDTAAAKKSAESATPYLPSREHRSPSMDSVMDLGDGTDEVAPSQYVERTVEVPFDFEKDTVPLPPQYVTPHWCHAGVKVDIVAEGSFYNKVGVMKKCVAQRSNAMKLLCVVIVGEAEVLFDPEALRPRHPRAFYSDKVWVWDDRRGLYEKGKFEGIRDDKFYVKLDSGDHMFGNTSNTFEWEEVSDDDDDM